MAKKGVKRNKDVKRIPSVAKQIKRSVSKKQTDHIHKKLDHMEQLVLWCLHLGTSSVSKIAQSTNLTTEEARRMLENLEAKNMVLRKNILGQYELTKAGAGRLGSRDIKLDTKIVQGTIRDGQETTLWIFAKNSGGAPLVNAALRIVVPQFVDVKRHSAGYYNDGDKNIVEFPLTQLHPGEMQSINFRVKGALPGGTISSTYELRVEALVGDAETDRKELNLFVSR